MDKKLASLINDFDFEQIELSLKEPNIFDALSIEHKEIRHSNFLAYILNPNENHGLRDIILKKFLRDIFSDSKANNRTVFDSDYLDLYNCEIRREWRNIDILIIFDKDIILIENKVDSVDHTNQLKRYKKIAEDNFTDKNRHYVYLTPFGSDPIDSDSRDSYINYSYVQVSEILEKIISLYKNSISEKIKYYLEDYLSTLKKELLMNDKLNDLALKVYNAHKEAFDFIFDNRPDPSSILYPYFERELLKAGFVIGSKNKGYIRFTTPELDKLLDKVGQGWPEKEIFLFEIEYFWTDKYCDVNAVIAPCEDSIKNKILDAVKELKVFKQPTGKKWLVFYKKKHSFIASEIIKEEQVDIENKVQQIINETKPVAIEICNAIKNKIKNGA